MPSMSPMSNSMPDPISSASSLDSYDDAAKQNNKKASSSNNSDPSQMMSQGAKFIEQNPEMLAL